jgi:CheY-like chemotaxis protein
MQNRLVLAWKPVSQPRRSVLVVDDSMLIRHTICRWLEERGFEVRSATNGVEALRCLIDRLPDLIITDLQMPKMDGRELIAALQSQPGTREIPVIILSTRSAGGQLVREHAHIFKDIEIESQLERALSEALARV